MTLTHEHRAALRALRTLTPQERLAALWQQEQQDLHEEETAKHHHLKAFRLSDAEWADFKAHIMDGGGSHDAHCIMRLVLQAAFDDDQETFWRELVHMLKSAGKHLGVISAQGGAVSISGVGPRLPIPPILEEEISDVGV